MQHPWDYHQPAYFHTRAFGHLHIQVHVAMQSSEPHSLAAAQLKEELSADTLIQHATIC